MNAGEHILEHQNGGISMGRVEKRMYRRKQHRGRVLRVVLVLVLLGMAIYLASGHGRTMFRSGLIQSQTDQMADHAAGQTVQTREVTLAEDAWYAIQTGIFSTEEAARQKADAYADRGAPGVIVQDGGKWRVFIACYGAQEDAAAVRTRLASNQKVETYQYAWHCPEVRLRLTGKGAQLDAAEAGFTLIHSVACTLRDTAIDLDAAQITTVEATAIVEALDGQITLWEETIRSLFGKNLPSLVQDMLSITASWADKRDAVLQAENATELSAALKAQAMGVFREIISWRNALLAS